jgi:bilirubin oxidase
MVKKKPSMTFALSVSVSVLICLTLLTGSGLAQLDPTTIPKYETPLFVPPAMPNAGTIDNGTVDYYEIAKRQFEQPVLPASMGLTTTVWGFGAINTPASFHWPSYTIEAAVDRRLRVKWINQLTTDNSATGNFLPHLFADDVDQGLHWANPPATGCVSGDNTTDCATTNGQGYFGPVPMVVHLHGSHVFPDSDGFPEAWFLPAANNIPAGYATVGSDYNQFKAEFAIRYPNAPAWPAGAAIFQYRNDQRATTLWFHDHSLGITRLNIYAGPAGFYFLRGGAADLPAGMLPAGAFEIPLMLQLRSFQDNGALDFANLGNNDAFVVNGRTWPFLNVEARRYRFRFLNADNEEPFDLGLSTSPSGAPITNAIWLIGADGGFLPAPVAVTNVPLHIAERVDVIIDFSNFSPGDVLYLVNGNGNAGTTDQALQFQVVGATSADTTTLPANLVLPARTPLGPADVIRKVSVNDGILAGKQLGTVADNGAAVPLLWSDNVTETPQFGDVEIWQIHNFDGGDHPIHIHMVQFEILGRRPLGSPDNTPLTPPGPGETGTKDTVFVDGEVIVHVKALFDIGGKFVWHCHILEHEDDEMMRPYEVLGGPAPAPEPEPQPEPEPEPTPITITTGGGGGGCAMVATKGSIKDIAGAYGALLLVALGLAIRRRVKRRDG